ncbi:MAG: hypothetical protein JRN15_03400 [Nitrososphaerota archaeon]|nr:hypothetical protein [Nitrososphaerota archaeon]
MNEKSTQTEESNTIELDLIIRRSPDSVRAWWTDLPSDYRASDPREQPYQILSKGLTANGDRELVCLWKSPDGSERQTEEIMHLSGDGLSWSFDVTGSGFSIRDNFKAVPAEGGTRLEIRSKITPIKPEVEAMVQTQKERMIQLWKSMVAICERDAPNLPSRT